MHSGVMISTSNCAGPRRRSAAACLLRLWVQIPLGGRDVFWECCVLSGRGICDEQITRPEESYRLWCVVVCDLETSWMRRLWLTWKCRGKKHQIISSPRLYIFLQIHWMFIVLLFHALNFWRPMSTLVVVPHS